MPRRSVRAIAGEWFGLDDDFERPAPPIGVRDWVLVVGVTAFSLLYLELLRGAGALVDLTAPVWVQWLTVASGVVLLAGRRRWPLTVAALAAGHMFVMGVTLPQIMAQPSLQIVYFVALFSAVAWGRDRRLMLVVVSAIVLAMFAWVAWQLAFGAGIEETFDIDDGAGVFGPIVSVVGVTLLVNAVYFGGAVLAGAHSWRTARQRARVDEQAAMIESQAVRLRDQAVVDERLRIARELHDVVAHHVSAMGVQAGAARRVMGKDPGVAEKALAYIEDASRDAVVQMRGLLGALRDTDGTPEAPVASEPDLSDLAALVEGARQQGVDVAYTLVERPHGAGGALPRSLGLSIFRTAQEALTNVARHSTASRAQVVVRVDRETSPPYAEVEIVDDGRPRAGSSGSGMGQLGIRERAATHRGQVEIGPRITGGYRVRVRYPLERQS